MTKINLENFSLKLKIEKGTNIVEMIIYKDGKIFTSEIIPKGHRLWGASIEEATTELITKKIENEMAQQINQKPNKKHNYSTPADKKI